MKDKDSTTEFCVSKWKRVIPDTAMRKTHRAHRPRQLPNMLQQCSEPVPVHGMRCFVEGGPHRRQADEALAVQPCELPLDLLQLGHLAASIQTGLRTSSTRDTNNEHSFELEGLCSLWPIQACMRDPPRHLPLIRLALRHSGLSLSMSETR